MLPMKAGGEIWPKFESTKINHKLIMLEDYLKHYHYYWNYDSLMNLHRAQCCFRKFLNICISPSRGPDGSNPSRHYDAKLFPISFKGNSSSKQNFDKFSKFLRGQKIDYLMGGARILIRRGNNFGGRPSSKNLKNLKKIAKMHYFAYFSQTLTIHTLFFRTFGRKT